MVGPDRSFETLNHVVKLLDSLLDAIVRLEGDALVMHVGEKPYVITASASMNAYRGPLAWGQVELSSRVLTFDAVSSMLTQILPADQQRALDEFGAIEHEILPPDGILDRFTVIAARGGEDVWIEVRRKPVAAPVADTPAVEPEPEPALVAAGTATAADAIAIHHEPDAIPAASSEPGSSDPAAETAAPPAAEPDHERPAAPVGEPGEPVETIVVALPGEDTEAVSLDEAHEHAIEIVDEEPQDVPTEEEVDAMMGATAAALLTSGLSVDDVPDESAAVAAPDAGGEADEEQVVSLDDMEPDVPSFELSPPLVTTTPEPGIDAPADDREAEREEEQPVAGSAETPLFFPSDVPAAGAPAAEHVVVEVEHQVPPLEVVEEETLENLVDVVHAPAEEHPTPIVVSDQPDVTDAFVGAIEITPGDEEEEQAFAVNAMNAGVEPAAPTAPPQVSDPSAAEMRMDATPEARHVDPEVPEAAPSGGSTIPRGDMATAGGTRSAFPGGLSAAGEGAGDGQQGVVVPMARAPIKPEIIAVPYTPAEDAALMKTLRAAAARGAATVYVVAQSKPMIRVDGDIVPLESEPALSADDVERLVQELAPPRRREALQSGPVEWLCDVPEIGRVRCLTFRDHRGPGVLFRMFPARAISADQLGLTPEVQALCQQSDGLVLVTGARASGKSTLLNAFVDLINRTRSDHVITVESQIGFVHESRRSFISQRETRGDADFAASVARAALREDPDVMMIEDLKSADLVSAALEAAESGRLVLASVPAASTIAALERLIEVFPHDRRARVRTTLATALRGVVAQVLLRRAAGGRVAAREILLNTPAVSTLVLEGKMFQLPVALESGRRHGMIPLTDSLAAHVRDGSVHAGEAYRKALDRAALVAVLKREGIDTSFAERMA
jgi:twitching motility protein PilT